MIFVVFGVFLMLPLSACSVVCEAEDPTFCCHVNVSLIFVYIASWLHALESFSLWFWHTIQFWFCVYYPARSWCCLSTLPVEYGQVVSVLLGKKKVRKNFECMGCCISDAFELI